MLTDRPSCWRSPNQDLMLPSKAVRKQEIQGLTLFPQPWDGEPYEMPHPRV